MSHFKRLTKEIANYMKQYPSDVDSDNSLIKLEEGVYLYVNNSDITRFRGLVFGPKDTAYQDGFYVFDFEIPDTYPFNPPKVTHLTTDGKVRFNPNLYEGGKVCLSILGTWSGPAWCSTMTILTVLQYLRMIMNEDPLRNEPGYSEPGKHKEKAKEYNEYVMHENIRYAILEVKHAKLFSEFQSVIDAHYETIKEKLLTKVTDLASKPVKDVETPYRHKFRSNYKMLLEKLV